MDHMAQCETSVAVNTTDPEYNQEFRLDVPDANCSQLEITLWDSKESKPNSFLGTSWAGLLNRVGLHC